MATTRTKGDRPTWDLQDRLAKALKHSGVSNKEMAERLQVSANTLNNYLRGHTRIPPLAVEAWAERTGVDLNWLLGSDDTQFDTHVVQSKRPT